MKNIGTRHPLGIRRTELGPEVLVNNEFENGVTGWTKVGEDGTHILTFSDSGVRFQSGTTSPQLALYQLAVMTVGVLYEVVFEISSWTSGAVKSDDFGAALPFSGVGVHRARRTAAVTSFSITRSTTNVDLIISSVSVRPVR